MGNYYKKILELYYMIIGNGDIAEVLQEVDRKDLLFFASGVSNSQEVREAEYKREIYLLSEQSISKHIVYFSSLCVFESDTEYARHKRTIEEIVKEEFRRYTIIRIGNITWGDNPHTLINFIRNKIRNHEKFEIRDVYRYIVDKEEFLYWIRRIPEWSCEMNIPGERLLVKDIVEKYGYIELHTK